MLTISRRIFLTESDCDQLADVLHATVHAGASNGFVLPFEMTDARNFWVQKVAPGVADGGRLLLVAEQDGKIAGTVQLIADMPPNQTHRADIAKLMVHPDARRQGIAKALMLELEKIASAAGRWLLVLDTKTGDAAEPLYLSMGYTIVGRIPEFARDPGEPVLQSTTILYKMLPR